MPREVVALVSADDVVAAVRVHADRVHDLLRRSGCGAEESVEVCESYAFGLVDAVVNAPETVGDMAGWWFGRALELGRRLGSAAAEPVLEESAGEMPTSVLAGTAAEAQVRAALADLPEQERAAVVLRDAYDLPPQAVAVALGRDIDGAAELVAVGRLRLASAYDNRTVPTLAGHTGRTPADRGTLGRLADGSLPPQRTVPLRRHLNACPACEEVAERQARARRLVAGLPVVAMPDEAREAMIERVATRAMAVLPSVEEVLRAIEEDDEIRPAVSPLVVVLAVVLALVLGVAVAAATTLEPSARHPLSGGDASEAPELPSFSVAPPAAVQSRSARPAKSQSATPTSSPTATIASPTATSTTSTPAAPASISLTPEQGPRGTTIVVAGRHWDPSATVTVTYTGALSSSSSTATADSRGRFSATVSANGALPGNYTVRAEDASQSATATFRQTS